MRVKSMLIRAGAGLAAAVFAAAVLPGSAFAGTDRDACKKVNDERFGCAHFFHNSSAGDKEDLMACDLREDGRKTTAQLRWGVNEHREVSNRASGTGCTLESYFIPEGTDVRLRACVEGLGCTEWKHAVA
jgi:hypothetical protein